MRELKETIKIIRKQLTSNLQSRSQMVTMVTTFFNRKP